MKLAVFSPYGNYHRESGFMYLIANYLLKNGADVVQLRCDGAFALCGRDEKMRWNRDLFACSRCMSEQRGLAQWSAAKSKELSSFLIPDDVLQSTKWIYTLRRQDLIRAEFRGINLWELAKDELAARFGSADVISLSGDQDQLTRELFISIVHAIAAVDRFVTAVVPTLHFIALSNDALSKSYAALVKSLGMDAAIFSFDQAEEAICIESLKTGSRYNTKLVLEGITAMRNDPRTWGPEVTSIVHEMLTFLGFAPDLVPSELPSGL